MAEPAEPAAETFDVLIVGAGLSGIGAAWHLQQRCASRSWAIVEARDAIGGTWDLFRYPGVRSDSDMYTLGYAFRPWTEGKAIADGPSILRYIRATADEAGITPRIRFGHRVTAAQWSSAEACWNVQLERRGAEGAAATTVTMRARWLYLCAGYYSYARGHRPAFEGEADYRGRIVHPQFWPADLDHADRWVVVVGSGATAVTLVPEMARTARHVTMLQRSPTYMVSMPTDDRIARTLARRLPARAAYALARWKNVLLGRFFYLLARRRPQGFRRRVVGLAAAQLPEGYDVARHFTPRYDPWDQRLCLVADGDLFRRIREGRASVVTDTIERFTERGLRLASGTELRADIVVLATGLELNVLGDIALSVDGRALDPARSMAYKGMMLADVPNLVMTFGYTNASWTLKADLTAAYTCRLLNHMARHGHRIAVPRGDPTVAPAPFLDFSSGYVQRALDRLPRQGARPPWRVHQSYLADLLALRWGRLEDGVMQFAGTGAPP